MHRILINTPAALGGIGATTNLIPALTLGCGAVGGGSSSDNVGPMNLLNVRKVGYGVRSIEDLRQPQPAAQTCSAPTSHSTSIFDDNRFAAPTAAVAPQAAPAPLYAQGDDRFGAVTRAVVNAAANDITEENVERIITEVLGRLSR